MRIVAHKQTQHFYVDGGFVQVAGNVVSILTSRAVPTTQIDPRVAAEQLSTARARSATNDEMLAEREALENQARAQLRIAKRR
jgi:F-type H+-transporting ATPase subunit epsilon